ncbi:MAG: nucleotidyltransferase domain-containing protein [Tannerella sp.]|jgi:predicted nucleotidyltransferase|nr:nucleotidyltransferase domain-containing protein [Tannerella sp.]
MDKGAINLNRKKVDIVIRDIHESLKNNGLKDHHIALFGSFYKGNIHEDSDIDMIIISKSFEGKTLFDRIDLIQKAKREVVKKHIVPIDILLKTPEEYEYLKRNFVDSEIVI